MDSRPGRSLREVSVSSTPRPPDDHGSKPPSPIRTHGRGRRPRKKRGRSKKAPPAPSSLPSTSVDSVPLEGSSEFSTHAPSEEGAGSLVEVMALLTPGASKKPGLRFAPGTKSGPTKRKGSMPRTAKSGGPPTASSSGDSKGKSWRALERMKSGVVQLKEELSLVDRIPKVMRTVTSSKEVVQLVEKGKEVARQLAIEMRKIKTIDDKVSEMQREINRIKTMLGGMTTPDEMKTSLRARLGKLENRYSEGVRRLNEETVKNQELKDKIGEARKEKVRYTALLRKLTKESEVKDRAKHELETMSRSTYYEGEEVQAQITSLRQELAREQARFTAEWRQLGKIIEQDKKVKVAMSGKAMDVGEGDGGIESTLKKRWAKGKWGGAKDMVSIYLSQERIAKYEGRFAEMQEKLAADGHDNDLESLVQTFIKREEEYGSLYEQVTTVRNEVEAQKRLRNELQRELERYKDEGVGAETVHKKILRTLEERVRTLHSRAEEYSHRLGEATRMVDRTRPVVQRVYESTGCHHQPFSLAVEGMPVTNGNIMKFLGIIEQRASEILTATSLLASASGTSLSSRRGPISALDRVRNLPAAAAVHIKPPTVDEVEAEDEAFLPSAIGDEMKPMSVEEVQQRTYHRAIQLVADPKRRTELRKAVGFPYNTPEGAAKYEVFLT